MKNCIVTGILFLSLFSSYSFSQGGPGKKNVINNVNAVENNNLVYVHYQLNSHFYQKSLISLYISFDQGRTFDGPLQKVSGDVGAVSSRGKKTIIWDAIAEKPFIEDSPVFEVRNEVTENKPKNQWFVQYTGNAMTYLGVRGGMIGLVGFYGEIRGNMRSFTKAEYSVKDDEVDYTSPGYYEFTGEKGYSALSVLGGIIFQPANSFYLYLGVGYGKENYLMKFNTYSYDGDIQTGSAYAKYEGYCNSGFETDAGIMLKINRILLSAGGTALSFKSFNWTAGVGITF